MRAAAKTPFEYPKLIERQANEHDLTSSLGRPNLALSQLLLLQASPVGQAVFDRLLKACGEVVWKGDTTSILVLNQIQVDAPYEPDNCKIIAPSSSSNGATATAAAVKNISSSSSSNGNGALEDGSLDRVKKIVAAAVAVDVTAPTGS